MTFSKQDWLQELISFCRSLSTKSLKQYKDFEELHHKVLDALRVHCQILLVDVKNVGQSLLIITHDQTEADEKVSVYEAKGGDDFGGVLEEQILTNDYFQRTKKIAIQFVSSIGKINSTINLHQPGILVRAESLIGKKDFLLLLSEACFSLKPKKFVEEWHQEVSRISSQTISHHLERKGVKIGTAIGGLWHPPIIIKEPPVLLSRTKIAECNYKGCKVLLYNNGLIIVVVSDKKWDYFAANQKKAKEILNEIIGTSNLFGVRGISFNIHDLTFFAINYDKMEIVAEMLPIEFTTRSLIEQVSTSDVATHIHKSLMEIEKDKLLEIISNAEKLTSNAKIKSYVSTYLDAVTHFYMREFKASFLLSWILLEKYIEDVWHEVLQKNKVEKKRFDKLVGIFWSTDDKIECLNLLGYFSKERYGKLMSLKKLRNKILHEDKTVALEKTRQSLDLSKTIILEVTKKANSK